MAELWLMEKIFTEWGMIYLLFFMIVAWFIWKGIPYLLKKFDDTTILFASTLKDQQELFSKEIDKISQTFLSQIEKSNSRHDKHSQQLDEIKHILIKKK